MISSCCNESETRLDTAVQTELAEAHAVSRVAQPEAPAGADVEASLARALDAAAKAGEWGIVAQLAKELEARRTGCG